MTFSLNPGVCQCCNQQVKVLQIQAETILFVCGSCLEMWYRERGELAKPCAGSCGSYVFEEYGMKYKKDFYCNTCLIFAKLKGEVVIKK
jgi:hypothetical protein